MVRFALLDDAQNYVRLLTEESLVLLRFERPPRINPAPFPSCGPSSLILIFLDRKQTCFLISVNSFLIIVPLDQAPSL